MAITSVRLSSHYFPILRHTFFSYLPLQYCSFHFLRLNFPRVTDCQFAVIIHFSRYFFSPSSAIFRPHLSYFILFHTILFYTILFYSILLNSTRFNSFFSTFSIHFFCSLLPCKTRNLCHCTIRCFPFINLSCFSIFRRWSGQCCTECKSTRGCSRFTFSTVG